MDLFRHATELSLHDEAGIGKKLVKIYMHLPKSKRKMTAFQNIHRKPGDTKLNRSRLLFVTIHIMMIYFV